MSLALRKVFALRDIDEAAGEARMRYITSVPGQEAVYMVKHQQALAYAAAFALDEEATAPPYIAAEATATAQTPIAVAENVIALADLWNGTVGPAIEGARLGGKAAVTAAADDEEVTDARSAALIALQAL